MSSLNILSTQRLVKLLKSGSSLPSVVETEDGNYVIKWNGSGEGTLSSAVDWITTHLAQTFGIPTVSPALIRVNSDFLAQTNYDEMRDIIAGSFGTNFGTKFIAEAKLYTLQDADKLEPSLGDRVFLFDVLTLNVDRTSDNPNVLIANNAPYFLDFSAAFEIRSIVMNHTVSKAGSETALLPTLREHPFYKADAEIIDFSKPLQLLDALIKSVPDEWLPENTDKQKILEQLFKLLENSVETLKRRLDVLETLPAPDPEAKRLKALENRKHLNL